MLETRIIPQPITQSALQIAQKMANKHRDPAKSAQVYQNILAVLAVKDYLQLLDIPTDIIHSDCWNPIVQLGADIADLKLPDLGSLECRSVTVNASHCQVPPEVWSDRLGYVIVQLDLSEKQATLLGFSPTPGTGTLELDKLQSIDAFLAHLDALTQTTVNLSQWLVNIFAQGWQELENLVNPPQLDWQLRGNTRRFTTRAPITLPENSVARVKLLDVGVQLGETNVALLVAIAPAPDQKFAIITQVHPAGGDAYLPPHLQLALVSNTGEVLQESESRNQDRWIQLRKFRVSPGTDFGLQISFHGMSIREAFSI